MTFEMNDTVRAGAHEVGDLWTVDRHLYLTEDKQRVVEEDDPEARWLWAAPGRQVPLAQAKALGAVEGTEPEAAADQDIEAAARAGVVADHEAQATHVVGEDHDEIAEAAVEPEEKQAAQPENKMVSAPEGDKADAKTVRAWARAEGIEVPAKGRIPDDVVSAYQDAHK